MGNDFSLVHDWKLSLKRIPSSFRPNKYYTIQSMAERKSLEALASVGVIGKNQLRFIFGLKSKEVRDMIDMHKLVEHKLIREADEEVDDISITIYTLGINGAKAIKLDAFENNYWMLYSTEDVLKRLLFFKLHERFKMNKVIPTPEPFVSAIQSNDGLVYVYVLKDSIDDLLRYLKWEANKRHRIILITESLKHLETLELYLKNVEIRIVIEEDLIAGKENIFHAYELDD